MSELAATLIQEKHDSTVELCSTDFTNAGWRKQLIDPSMRRLLHLPSSPSCEKELKEVMERLLADEKELQRERFESARKSPEIRGLVRILKNVLENTPIGQAKSGTVLLVGCGTGEEGIAVNLALGRGWFGHLSSNVQTFGIDCKSGDIASAQKLFSKPRIVDDEIVFEPYSNFTFLKRDATKPDGYLGIPPQVGLVIVRHQNYASAPLLWKEIFWSCLKRLSADGKLIITSHSDEEHELAVNALRELGGVTGASIRNFWTKPFPQRTPRGEEMSTDRWVSVFTK